LEQCDSYKTTKSQMSAACVHVPATSMDIVCMHRKDFMLLIAGEYANEPGRSYMEPVEGSK